MWNLSVYWLGGSGDLGRDIIAYRDEGKKEWDNFQCKHYNKKLSKSDILNETSKFLTYCYEKKISLPQKYFFVSPKGLGSNAHDLISNPTDLKEKLKAIAIKEGGNEKVDFIDKIDFSIFSYIEPLEFLTQFKETPYYAHRFGRFFKARKIDTKDLPKEIEEKEVVYIRKILDAYSEYLDKKITNIEDLKLNKEIVDKINRHREYFFSAESLKEFSEELLDTNCDYFEHLKDEFYEGIIETIEDDFENGLKRLNEVLKRSALINITNNPLTNDMKAEDRKGVCHHLSNEREDIAWVK